MGALSAIVVRDNPALDTCDVEDLVAATAIGVVDVGGNGVCAP
jgi:hypothetical protein